jgi:hypothetical protein
MSYHAELHGGSAMVTAIISLLAVTTFGLIAGAFVSALTQLNEIDPVGEGQTNEKLLAANEEGPVIPVRGLG